MTKKDYTESRARWFTLGVIAGILIKPILMIIGSVARFYVSIMPLILLCVSLRASDLTSAELVRKAAIVRIVEGDRFYGVRSIKVTDETQAFRVTTNSICKSHARWEKAGRPGEFVDFFAARWCPHPVGNPRWRKNARYYKF